MLTPLAPTFQPLGGGPVNPTAYPPPYPPPHAQPPPKYPPPPASMLQYPARGGKAMPPQAYGTKSFASALPPASVPSHPSHPPVRSPPTRPLPRLPKVPRGLSVLLLTPNP